MAPRNQRRKPHSRKDTSPQASRAGGLKMLAAIGRDFAGLLEGRRRAEGQSGGPTIRSQVSLDFVNLFEADVTTGIGPFLSVYLRASRHWDPAQIGMAISAQGIAVMLAQTPAGALVDATTRKRLLLALASITIGIGSIAITVAPGLPGVIAAQAAIGVAGALVPLLVAAISLGLVGRARLSRRVGRNEAFNHAGNVLGAIFAGILGHALARRAIFYMAAVMSVLTAGAAISIREREIDHRLAREGKGEQGEDSPIAPFIALARDWRLMVFAASVLLFQLANGAILPLVGEVLANTAAGSSELYMSWSIIAGQCVMIPIAIFAGYFCAEYGRKPTMLIAFVALPIYAALCTATTDPLLLVGVQALGGVTSGILTVVAIQIVNDIARGSGRFNLMEGLVFTCLSVGPSLSNLFAGFVARRAGFDAAFYALAGIGALALAVFAIFMPETKR
ncbi:MAG TPA: MFS transporter [Candidatus Binataceae bacterium]|nr:MFS transporter [Candidatus Binataceae bacterium]